MPENLQDAAAYITQSPKIVSVYITLTAFCHSLLMRVIWKRCVQCENFVLQNMIITSITVADIVAALGIAIAYILSVTMASHSHALLYFLVTPALMIQEIHIVLITANRYIVCIYGLVYPLVVTRWRVGAIILAVWSSIYILLIIALLATGGDEAKFYLASHSMTFKLVWSVAQLLYVIAILSLNIRLFCFAKQKLKNERKVVPLGMVNLVSEEHDLLARNLKRTAGTVFLSLFYSVRILPHAVLKLTTTVTTNYFLEKSSELAFLTELYSSSFDPIILIVSIKIVRDGLKNEWHCIKTAVLNFIYGDSY